jgi:8-oxo-dGTP diphosphatase
MASLLNESLHLNEHEASRWLSKEEIHSVNWLPADIMLLPLIVKELGELNFEDVLAFSTETED